MERKTKRKLRTAGALATMGLAAGLAVAAAKGAEISNPDYTGRQKFWTLNPSSMGIYRGLPEHEFKIGDTKYRLGHSLTRAGFDTYDIRMKGKKRGELKERFRVLGERFTMTTPAGYTEVARPFQLFKHRWTLKRNSRPHLILEETLRSVFVPTVRAFDLIDPTTNRKIGYLSAKWNLRRFLIGRRDYGVKFERGFERHLTRDEIAGVLTAIGKLTGGLTDFSSSDSSGSSRSSGSSGSR